MSIITVANGTAHKGSFLPLHESKHTSYEFFLGFFVLLVGCGFGVVDGLIFTFVIDPLGAITRILRFGANGTLGGPGWILRDGSVVFRGRVVAVVEGVHGGLRTVNGVGGVDLNVIVGRLVPSERAFVM